MEQRSGLDRDCFGLVASQGRGIFQSAVRGKPNEQVQGVNPCLVGKGLLAFYWPGGSIGLKQNGTKKKKKAGKFIPLFDAGEDAKR